MERFIDYILYSRLFNNVTGSGKQQPVYTPQQVGTKQPRGIRCYPSWRAWRYVSCLVVSGCRRRRRVLAVKLSVKFTAPVVPSFHYDNTSFPMKRHIT